MATTPYVDPQDVHNPTTTGVPPASWGDTVRDDLQSLARPAMCVATRTTTQSLTDSTVTAVQLNAADELDTDGFHSTTTNNTRITVPAGLGGWYEAGATVGYASNSVGNRIIQVRVNGTTTWASFTWSGATSSSNTLSAIPLLLSAGDYVEALVFQNSGGALNLNSARAWLRLVSWA